MFLVVYDLRRCPDAILRFLMWSAKSGHVTVDGVRRGFHYSAILIFQQPTRCINRATVAKSSMSSIYKCSWNILVTFRWFQLATRVDRRHSWWKTNLKSWYVRRVFVWRRHFLLNTSCDDVLLSCVSFLKIPQNVCNSTWWRQHYIIWRLTGKLEARVFSKHLHKLTYFLCQIVGLRRSGVLVHIQSCINTK